MTKKTEQNPGGAEAPPVFFDKDLQPPGCLPNAKDLQKTARLPAGCKKAGFVVYS